MVYTYGMHLTGLDVIIILFTLAALARGARLGFVRQASSTVGLILGLVMGIFIEAKLLFLMDTPGSKLLFAILVVLASIALVGGLSEQFGKRLKHRIEASTFKLVAKADTLLGSLLSAATLLVVIWLMSALVSGIPVGDSPKPLRSSAIVATLRTNLPAAPTVITKLGHWFDPNRFPEVFSGLEPNVDTSKPLPSIGELDPAVKKVRPSVVKIQGAACGKGSQGSGFIAAPNIVITNAHVVAGMAAPFVLDGGGRHRATVIAFDPELDMAILRTTGLAGEPLAMVADEVDNGTPGAVVGYPHNGDFTADPAVLLELFHAVGRNIYSQGRVVRDVYSVKSVIEPGNSGGPLIDKEGRVIGLVFAESTTNDNLGFALTMDKVIAEFERAKNRSEAVATSCAQ